MSNPLFIDKHDTFGNFDINGRIDNRCSSLKVLTLETEFKF